MIGKIVLIYDYLCDRKAIRLMERLEKMRISVIPCTQATGDTGDLIKKADYFFILLVDDALFPRELAGAIDSLIVEARNRDKQLYLIKEYNALIPPDLIGYPILEPYDGTMCSPNGGNVAGMICDLVVTAKNKQILYEKISALKTISYTSGIEEALVELCHVLHDEIAATNPGYPKRKGLFKELLQCYRELAEYGETGYDNEQRALAHKRQGTLERIDSLLQYEEFTQDDPYYLAYILNLLNLEVDIASDCIDTLTNGDVHIHKLGDNRVGVYQQLTDRFVSSLNKGWKEEDYTADERELIHREISRLSLPQSAPASPKSRTQAAAPESISDTDAALHSIAEYMRTGYQLFDSLSSDREAADFLRCLKTSFERLKNYCDIIDAKRISAECIHYISTINQRLESLDEDSARGDKAELGLKALLGLRLPNSGEYDVFISYKHADADIVRGVYHFLKSQLLNVFFDKVTLPELSESDYDEAIMNALDRSRHFIVVLSDLDYLNSYWIKLEMKTFSHEISEGRKPNANFIILVTDSVYQQIIQSNKECIPIRYRSCEIMRISEYKTAITGYLKK